MAASFIDLHKSQLLSIGLPEKLWKTLCRKLDAELMDLGDFVELHVREGMGQHKGEGGEMEAVTAHLKRGQHLTKEGHVFLIDHVWTSDGCRGAKHDLTNNEKLVAKLEELFNLQHCSNGNGLQYDDANSHQVAAVMKVANVSSKTARNLLNSTDQELISSIMSVSAVAPTSDTSSQQSKHVTFEEFRAALKGSLEDRMDDDEHAERLYKGFIENQSDVPRQEGRRECQGYSWVENQDDGTITVTIRVPRFCKKKDIENKLSTKTWQFGLRGRVPMVEGEFYHPVISEECFWTIESNGEVQMMIQKNSSNKDTWPYLLVGEQHLDVKKEAEFHRVKEQCCMEERVDIVLNAMWRYNQTYQAMTREGQQSRVWYVMDEAGCVITHSSSPNCRCAPFACCTTGKFYSILWPIKNVKSGDMLTRDCCPRLSADEAAIQIRAREMAFQEDICCPSEFVTALFASRKITEDISVCKSFVHVPIIQTPPTDSSSSSPVSLQFKLFTDTKGNTEDWPLDIVSLVNDATQADIVWISNWSSVDVNRLTPTQCITRLMGDECLTHKDKLSQTLSNAGLSHVDWLPVTYDLTNQLPELIADHENRGMFNWWIVKRCFLSSRIAEFPVVTNDVRRIIRLVETGPCVATHFYLSSALFNDKRLALGYSVVVHAVDPLRLFVHAIPSVRVCERAAGDLNDYDHYDCSSLITNPTCLDVKWDDVKSGFEKQLTGRNQQWSDIETHIHQLIADVFSAAAGHLSVHSACQCRGVYEVNVLLLSSFQPLLLSIDPLSTGMPPQRALDILSFLRQLIADDDKANWYHSFFRLC